MTDFTAACATIAKKMKEQVGYQLFTITRVLPNGTQVERIFTTHPDVYPVTGLKPIYDDAWTEKVIRQAQTYLAATSAEMVPYFPDLDVINGLGLGSVINMPLVVDGQVVGTINILDAENFYCEAHISKLAPFVPDITAMIQTYYPA